MVISLLFKLSPNNTPGVKQCVYVSLKTPVERFVFIRMALTIITGGARSVDLAAGKLAKQYGLQLHVLIPPCHPRKASIPPLTYQQLAEAIPVTQQVAVRLGKQLTSPISQQYILRNYHIVSQADRVLAFTCLSLATQVCPGGTGWGVDMAIVLRKSICVYDVERRGWFWYNPSQEVFQACDPDQYPTLVQKTAIIGMRHIDEYPEALLELQNTFHRSVTFV